MDTGCDYDLDSIGKYIALDSELAAQKLIREIISKAELLADNPHKGRPIPENFLGDYRQILHKSYRIIYRVKRMLFIFHQ